MHVAYTKLRNVYLFISENFKERVLYSNGSKLEVSMHTRAAVY